MLGDRLCTHTLLFSEYRHYCRDVKLDVDHSVPYSFYVKNEWSYTFILLYAFMMWTKTILHLFTKEVLLWKERRKKRCGSIERGMRYWIDNFKKVVFSEQQGFNGLRRPYGGVFHFQNAIRFWRALAYTI